MVIDGWSKGRWGDGGVVCPAAVLRNSELIFTQLAFKLSVLMHISIALKL